MSYVQPWYVQVNPLVLPKSARHTFMPRWRHELRTYAAGLTRVDGSRIVLSNGLDGPAFDVVTGERIGEQLR